MNVYVEFKQNRTAGNLRNQNHPLGLKVASRLMLWEKNESLERST